MIKAAITKPLSTVACQMPGFRFNTKSNGTGMLHRVLAATLVAAFSMAAPAASTQSTSSGVLHTQRCAGTGVDGVGVLPPDFADICAGVRSAISFLASEGLAKESAFTIEVAAALPERVGQSAAGCFLEDRKRAYVLPYSEFRKKRTWFGVPVSRDLYQSLSAHEAAHAVATCHFEVAAPSIQAKEYIAYVTMFSTMPAALRSKALRFLPGTGFSDVSHVSSFVYQFDPMQFGANSYRHFISLDDGKAFLRDVLSGKVFAE